LKIKYKKVKYKDAEKLKIVNKIIEHWRKVNNFPEWQKNLIIKAWKMGSVVLRIDSKFLKEV
jgi:hypothetical protein